jgi:hypothetical protein
LHDEGSDGVIVATGRHGTRPAALEMLRDLVSQGLQAVVLLDRSPEPRVPAIRVDVELGARLAVEHLEWIVRGPDTLSGGHAMMCELIDRPGPRPSAALIYNDLTAIGALRALQERGLFDMGYASAIVVVLFVAVLTLTVLQLAARRWWVFEGEGGQHRHRGGGGARQQSLRRAGNVCAASGRARHAGRPIVYDAAFSASAHGKIRVFQQRRQPLPAGWALDQAGRPTTDPSAAIDGLLLPIGDFKGANLAFVMGLLSCMLSGASYGTELGDMYAGPHAGQDGHFACAIRIDAFEDVLDTAQQLGIEPSSVLVV